MKKSICYGCFAEKDKEEKCPFCGFDESPESAEHPLALPVGTVLAGKYIVGRTLGQGGFGITYIAQDYNTKELVALKEFFPDSLATRTAGTEVSFIAGDRKEAFLYGKKCFLSEAKTLSEFIDNEHIVQVYNYFEENSTAYFTMEYLHGQSLISYIKRAGGRINCHELKNIFVPVMDALAYVHSKGVIHRDISPDNIIITDSGKIKIIDFGAARYSLGDRSRSLDVILKHGYAPKEQYTRHGRQGPYTDIYALAATMYYALTGQVPPDSVDRADEDTLIPLSSCGCVIPENIEKAIIKALSPQASDRFQSMGEFKEACFVEEEDRQNTIPFQEEFTSIESKPEDSLDNLTKEPPKQKKRPGHKTESNEKTFVKLIFLIEGIVILALVGSILLIHTLIPEFGGKEQGTNDLYQQVIADSAYAHSDLESIDIPYGTTSIGDTAFYECHNLSSVTIPDSVTNIGKYTFMNCDSLERIILPDSVTKIGKGAFFGCTNLKSITLPNSITEIPESMFMQCSVLQSVTIPRQVKIINEYAFAKCNSLERIIISDSVTGIMKDAFSMCPNLTEVIIGKSVITVGERSFSYCDSLKTLTIGESVQTIGEGAFNGCESLESVIIPDSVTTISDNAFRFCRELSDLTIGENVTIIGVEAFSGCKKLKSVTIPKNVTEIQEKAFANCTVLESISVPTKCKVSDNMINTGSTIIDYY